MVELNKILVTTSTYAITLAVASSTTAAFSPPVCASLRQQRHLPLLLESPSDQNELGDNSPAHGQRSQKYSTARIGGRRAKKEKIKAEDNNNGLFAIIRQFAVPVILMSLFFRLLLGNLFGGGSNVVYYSSTVYQSTTYSRDGNIETKRQASFKSNVPGLVERAKEISQENNGNVASRGSYYDINSIEDEILDVEDEINSIFGKW